jgi:hypothetical protein
VLPHWFWQLCCPRFRRKPRAAAAGLVGLAALVALAGRVLNLAAVLVAVPVLQAHNLAARGLA